MLWFDALRRDAPNLPTPIAQAMVESVARGPWGETLFGLEQALIKIRAANLDELTGSEVQLLTAILRQMNEAVEKLQGEIAILFESKEK
ncbi:MAG: hypothetical protein HY327_02830 [Chloroflexi bacterium]|nr:hypothetical protein [Chloroflexota bacterium]